MHTRDSVTRLFASGFFHESSSPKPLKLTKGPFSKIYGDIHKSRCTTGISNSDGKIATVVNNTSGKFAIVVNTTSGKFAIGINYTGGKFATGTAGVVDTSGELPPPVLTTPAVNLPLGIMETIADFLHPEVNKKAKIYLLVKSTTQRCPNKIFKTFLSEDFFICHWWCNITENIERVSIYHSRICSMYNKPSRSC